MIVHKTNYGSFVSKAQQNEPPISEFFNTYLQMNPGIGYLAFEVFDASPVSGRVPVPNAKITVSKLLGNDYYLSKIITTDANGETDPLPLPAVSREISQRPGEVRTFTPYHVSVEAPGYQRRDIFDVQVFEGVTTLQRVPVERSVSGGSGTQAGPTRISMG